MAGSREGDVLGGKYRLERLLGAGGMGEVYRAENTAIGRVVAIKLLRAEFVSQPPVVTRFLREAKAANRVRHPNVVDVLDVGEEANGAPFIVQEFLHGQDLATHFEDLGGRLSPRAALSILLPVIDAVGCAHKAGVVHRDLKPENVFLARVEAQIVPKVLDFGISRIADDPSELRLTATNIAMGTPLYMAPEAIKGLRYTDARSDVWSLGVMIYELLSGSPPFTGESQGGLFLSISADVPPALDPSVAPPALSRLVMRCLEKNPADRYADAAELAAALRGFLDQSGGFSALSATAAASALSPPRAVPVAPDAQQTMPARPANAHANAHANANLPASSSELASTAVELRPTPAAPAVAAAPAVVPAAPAAPVARAVSAPEVVPATGGAVGARKSSPELLSGLSPVAAAPVARAKPLVFRAPGDDRSSSERPPNERASSGSRVPVLMIPTVVVVFVLCTPILAVPLLPLLREKLRLLAANNPVALDVAALASLVSAFFAQRWSSGEQLRFVAWDLVAAAFALCGVSLGLFSLAHPTVLGSISPDAMRFAVAGVLPWCLALSPLLLGIYGIRRGIDRIRHRLLDVTDALVFGLSIALAVAGLRFSIDAREPEPAARATVSEVAVDSEPDAPVPARRATPAPTLAPTERPTEPPRRPARRAR